MANAGTPASSRRRALVVLGTALATLCGLLLPLGLATRGAPRLEAAATTAPALTFVSEGDYDPTYAADIDADGRHVAFTEGGSLLLRDQAVATTTTLPTPGLRYVQVPTLSGDARLVGFVGTRDVEATSSQDLYVVDRAGAGGDGVLRRVTGTPNDLPHQRQPPCDQAEAVCPPHLSRDGRALVSPASFSVVSPNLSITADQRGGSTPPDGWQGPLVDLGDQYAEIERAPAPVNQIVRVEVTGPEPVTFPAPGPLIEGDDPFGIARSPTPCVGTIDPGATCTVVVTYAPATCATIGAIQHHATLRLPGTTPAGQAELAVIARLQCTAPPRLTAQPPVEPPPVADTCVGDGTVTAPLPTPQTPRTDHANQWVFPLGEVEVGKTSLFALSLTNSTGFPLPVTLRSPGCGMRLVVPPSAPAAGCRPGQDVPAQESCVAYVEARSSEVAAFAGMVYLGSTGYRLSATAVSNAALLWRDPSGQGNFGSAPPVVVSQGGRPDPRWTGGRSRSRPTDAGWRSRRTTDSTGRPRRTTFRWSTSTTPTLSAMAPGSAARQCSRPGFPTGARRRPAPPNPPSPATGDGWPSSPFADRTRRSPRGLTGSGGSVGGRPRERRRWSARATRSGSVTWDSR